MGEALDLLGQTKSPSKLPVVPFQRLRILQQKYIHDWKKIQSLLFFSSFCGNNSLNAVSFRSLEVLKQLTKVKKLQNYLNRLFSLYFQKEYMIILHPIQVGLFILKQANVRKDDKSDLDGLVYTLY